MKNNIKEIRTKKGITQSDLAKKLGITQSALSQFERRSTPLKITTLLNIANALQVPARDLIDDDYYSSVNGTYQTLVMTGSFNSSPLRLRKEIVSALSSYADSENNDFSDDIVDLGEKKVLQRGGDYVRSVNDSPVPIDSDTYKPLFDLLRDMRMWEEEDIKKIIEYAEILRFWKDYSILKK